MANVTKHFRGLTLVYTDTSPKGVHFSAHCAMPVLPDTKTKQGSPRKLQTKVTYKRGRQNLSQNKHVDRSGAWGAGGPEGGCSQGRTVGPVLQVGRRGPPVDRPTGKAHVTTSVASAGHSAGKTGRYTDTRPQSTRVLAARRKTSYRAQCGGDLSLCESQPAWEPGVVCGL